MNPGILSIASYLNYRGYPAKIIDLSLETNYSDIERKINSIKSDIVGISSTSGFDYIESLKIASIVKKISKSKIIIGGQHAGPLGKIVLEDSKEIDAVVKYEGEVTVEKILNNLKRGKNAFIDVPGIVYRSKDRIIDSLGRAETLSLNDLPPLDYSIYPNFHLFTPFVEESRGCTHKCSYCTSNTVNGGRINLKNPEIFKRDLDECVKLFGKDKNYAILASTFGVGKNRGNEIINIIGEHKIGWETEFRADSCWRNFLESLFDANCSVVNIGLESASPKILKLMNKTKHPEKYLKDMQSLAKKIHLSETQIRVNFMFYAGETPETLKETLKFLHETPEINSLIFSPLIAYHGTPLLNNFDFFRKKYGSELIEDQYWNRRRIYPVHPSKYFSFQEVANLGSTLEKIFSDEKSWCKSEIFLHNQNEEKIRSNIIDSKFRR